MPGIISTIKRNKLILFSKLDHGDNIRTKIMIFVKFKTNEDILKKSIISFEIVLAFFQLQFELSEIFEIFQNSHNRKLKLLTFKGT